MKKTAFAPQLTMLEDRAQPGSMFSTGLEASMLAGAFLGDALMKASRPAIVGAQTPAKKADTSDVAAQPLTEVLNTQSAGTIKQVATQSLDNLNGLTVPTQKTFATLREAMDVGSVRPSDSGSRGHDPIFFGGDFNGNGGLSNEAGTVVSDSNTWDDLRIRGAITVEAAFGDHWILPTTTLPLTANVEIRGPGVFGGTDKCLTGSVVYQALNVPVTTTDIGDGGGNYDVIRVEADIPDFVLPQGHYYLNVQPNGAGNGQYFVAETYGASGVGQPIANGGTYLESAFFGFPCSDWQDLLGPGTWDVSFGLRGDH